MPLGQVKHRIIDGSLVLLVPGEERFYRLEGGAPADTAAGREALGHLLEGEGLKFDGPAPPSWASCHSQSGEPPGEAKLRLMLYPEAGEVVQPTLYSVAEDSWVLFVVDGLGVVLSRREPVFYALNRAATWIAEVLQRGPVSLAELTAAVADGWKQPMRLVQPDIEVFLQQLDEAELLAVSSTARPGRRLEPPRPAHDLGEYRPPEASEICALERLAPLATPATGGD